MASRRRVRRSRRRLQHLRQVRDHQEVADDGQYLHEQLFAEQVEQVRDGRVADPLVQNLRDGIQARQLTDPGYSAPSLILQNDSVVVEGIAVEPFRLQEH